MALPIAPTTTQFDSSGQAPITNIPSTTPSVSATSPGQTIAIEDIFLVPGSPLIEKKARVLRTEPVKPKKTYGLKYKLKQYGTNAMVIFGSATAIALLCSPEPFVTKLIGTILAVALIVAGVWGKHAFFKQAYMAQALEETVGKLTGKINKLQSQIHKLSGIREELVETTGELTQTKRQLDQQIGELRNQVERLKTEVNVAFDKLNEDRSKFETEKKIKLDQLNSQIEEADEKETRINRELTKLATKEAKLDALEVELGNRRKSLLEAETKLQKLQKLILQRNLSPRAQ